MCNINLLVKKITQKDLAILEVVCHESFKQNSDSEGYLTPKVTKCSTNKIFLSQQDDIVGQPWIAVHSRLSTQGDINTENAQPIVQPNIITLHNGMLWGYNDNKKSDTFMFAKDINNVIEESKKTEENFIETIETEIAYAYGSKSLLMFDRNNLNLYYYKNSDTTFFKTKGKEGYFCSTSYKNAELVMEYYGWNTISPVNSDMLFQVEKNDMRYISYLSEYDYTAQSKKVDSPDDYYYGYHERYIDGIKDQLEDGTDIAMGITDDGQVLDLVKTDSGEYIQTPENKNLAEKYKYKSYHYVTCDICDDLVKTELSIKHDICQLCIQKDNKYEKKEIEKLKLNEKKRSDDFDKIIEKHWIR